MKILLVGFSKSGNTWARFVIFNYWNILTNNAKETLTYRELIKINENILDGIGDQYPQVYFMHVPKSGKTILGINRDRKIKLYNKIDKIIYVCRNPFDVMISYFDYLYNRDIPFNGNFKGKKLEEISNLKGFIKKFLPLYIDHIKSTKHLADVVLDYDQLRANPNGFRKALELVYGDVNEKIFQKAIEMSSFESIKTMGIKFDQRYGLASSYRGSFTRNGRSGQYLEVMSKELIEYIKNECRKEGIKI